MTNRIGIYLGLLVLALAAGGCAFKPLHNDKVDARTSRMTLSAFTVVESSPVKVQCRPYLVGRSWQTIKSFVGSSSPSMDIAARGGKLYSATTSFVVPDDCWYHWHSQATTELRFMGGPYTEGSSELALAVFDEDGMQCVRDTWIEGGTYQRVFNDCRLKTTSGQVAQSIYVHTEEPD